VDEVSQAILLLFTEKFQQGYMSLTLNKDRQLLVEHILPDQDIECIASSAKLLDIQEGLDPFPLQHQAYICTKPTKLSCHQTDN
jgi:hypothetical protein